ncbi:integration host factor subunit beta [Opitutales bacterium]|uniref:HU family DNA-binding protein n=1 Tax=Candidatus Chordibacter forsetii TaxID=3381758 RepID=UPI002314DF54|nr:integration host factor subunit beta [Opitutales bacterium]MDA9119638.1 integration host factor subunit beta [Opitutales bacterium]MDC0369016.1 integration host factor subunit beta [Opitutales bacterium]
MFDRSLMDGNLWKTYPKPLPQVFQTDLPQMSNNLTKRQIVQSIYEGANYNHKDVTEIVQKTLDHICEGLIAGQNVELRNFGVFELQVRKSRVGRNPNQPKKDVVIPRRAVVKFKAGKGMKAGLTKIDLDSI